VRGLLTLIADRALTRDDLADLVVSIVILSALLDVLAFTVICKLYAVAGVILSSGWQV
jgi:hypothetical protein